jgi:hypothetical protein
MWVGLGFDRGVGFDRVAGANEIAVPVNVVDAPDGWPELVLT